MSVVSMGVDAPMEWATLFPRFEDFGAANIPRMYPFWPLQMVNLEVPERSGLRAGTRWMKTPADKQGRFRA